jgi:hypothetical protein
VRLRHKSTTTIASLDSTVRELAYRVSDGIHVLLLWHPVDDSVSISVDDERTGERFELPVDRDRAMFAFNHPFAYAG